MRHRPSRTRFSGGDGSRKFEHAHTHTIAREFVRLGEHKAHRTVLYIHSRSYARCTFTTAWRRTGLLVLGVWAAKGLSHPVSPGVGDEVFTYIHRSGISWTRWNMNGVLQPTNWTSSRASPDTKAQPAAVQCVCVHYYILVQSTLQRLYPAVYPLPTTYYNIPYPVRPVSRVIAPLRCFPSPFIFFHRLHNDIVYNIYPDKNVSVL